MNSIRNIQTLNKRELEAGIHNPNASWHADYRDTAFVSFGGLPFSLSEGDVLAIFSQFGEPVYLKLMRDKETGKSRGFGWLKYEDQRSTDLAVDNLAGADIGGRLVRVDHARYKIRDDEDPDEGRVGWEDMLRRERAARGADPDRMDTDEDGESEGEEDVVVQRPMLQEERELARLLEEHDDDDPMKAFLIEEKKKDVELALQKYEKKDGGSRKHKHRHHHHHRSHRSRREDSEGRDRDRDHDRERRKRSRRDETPVAEGRTRADTPEARDRSRDKDRERDRRPRDDVGERRGGRQDSHRERGEGRDREERRRRDRDGDADDREKRTERRRERGHDDTHERRREHKRDYSEDRDKEQKEHKSRRKSRSRSPRSRRDR
ncbi:uncharacterized protein PG998_011881 [Apiospora kogelbergensis]|uniref:uncharacterized protein n=1 Tax=Apiospora kogelbergensis TaxID=1337665 RepID=UPI00312E024C